MDLVASYDSDIDNGSDIEEIKTHAPASKTKQVDVINLDSETDDESASASGSAVEKNNSETGLKNTKIVELNSKSIDCIDLEKDLPSDTSNVSSKQIDVSKLLSNSSDKKIDYLNLEGSDTEDESENAVKNMKSLMEAASTLSNVPSGPTKLKDLPDSAKSVIENSYPKDMDNATTSNISSNINCGSARNTPDFALANISRNNIDLPGKKRFKGDASIETSFETDMNDFRNEKDASSIFREDERVIEASKKNVVCRIPRQIVQTHAAHTNIVTSLNWCIPKFSYLFLSASLDGSIKIWDLYKQNFVQCIKATTGINAAKWSYDGGQIVAGGHGEKAFVLDVHTGRKIIAYDIYNIVTSMEIVPYMEDVFLCGTRNAILGFDIRVNTAFPIRSFFSKCEEVLDIVFLDENEFICSTNIVSRDSADRTIMAWDFSSGAILSNQIFLERYTCPSLKVHPTDSSFVAQTNGNYIASFSTSRPYKIKDNRYMGHKVSGYGIECDISPDGKYLVSGDAEGNVFFYNYSNTNRVLFSSVSENKPGEEKKPVNRVKWHPAFSSTVITATYDGQIQLWK